MGEEYESPNGNPWKLVQQRLDKMTLDERTQLKVGWRKAWGSIAVVYGTCYECKRQRCEFAVNGMVQCPDMKMD